MNEKMKARIVWRFVRGGWQRCFRTYNIATNSYHYHPLGQTAPSTQVGTW